MTRLILFSGGVESTALLTIASPGDFLLTIDVEIGSYFSSVNPKNAHLIADRFGLELRTMKLSLPKARDKIDFVHQLEIFVGVANVVARAHSEISAVWCGKNSAEPSGATMPTFIRTMKAWDVVSPDVPFLHPLDSMTKRQQWDLIPEDVQPLVVSCVYHQTYKMPIDPTCAKCKEVQEMLNDAR
jgi:7-cyano-7-deazaguanine synthase in queuosine biosynthesis